MKKTFSLLVICLLLTSCGNKQNNNQQNQENNQTEQKQEKGTFVTKTLDDYSIYTFNDSIMYNGDNLKEALQNKKYTIEEVVSNYGYTSTEDLKSNMYIVDVEPAFYVMFCGTEENTNIYISTDFDEAFNSCK